MADESTSTGSSQGAPAEAALPAERPSGPSRPGVAAHQRRVSELAAEERRDAERRAEREAEGSRPPGSDE